MALKKHHPKLRLTELVDRPGGKRREDAVAEARRRVEKQRAATGGAIADLITSLERADLAHVPLDDVARTADRIVSLSSAFDLVPLSEAAKRLYDLAQLFARRGTRQVGPLTIHVHALRLLSARTVETTQSRAMLGELDNLLAHLASA